MKPTNNKAPKSWAIRKWSIPQEEIKKIARELTEKQVIQEVEAPAIESEQSNIYIKHWSAYLDEDGNNLCTIVDKKTNLEEVVFVKPVLTPRKCEKKSNATPWNYEAYAAALQAIIDENETVTVSKQALLSIFPQTKHVKNIAQNLKRTYGIDYRCSDLWEYVFFDGETKDEIIERIKQEKTNWENSARYLSQANSERHERYTSDIKEQQEVIHDLQSDLYTTKYQRNRLLFLVILLIIIITLTNYHG
jgi:DNA repair exonuclease SbcCD ATPase subunit